MRKLLERRLDLVSGGDPFTESGDQGAFFLNAPFSLGSASFALRVVGEIKERDNGSEIRVRSSSPVRLFLGLVAAPVLFLLSITTTRSLLAGVLTGIGAIGVLAFMMIIDSIESGRAMRNRFESVLGGR